MRWKQRGYGFVHCPGVDKDVFVFKKNILCAFGEPCEALKHWDVELRIVPDRKDPNRLVGLDVSGPNGRRIPMPTSSV